jgi:hypothetical protein
LRPSLAKACRRSNVALAFQRIFGRAGHAVIADDLSPIPPIRLRYENVFTDFFHFSVCIENPSRNGWKIGHTDLERLERSDCHICGEQGLIGFMFRICPAIAFAILGLLRKWMRLVTNSSAVPFSYAF